MSWLRAHQARCEPVILMYHGVLSDDQPHWLGGAHNHLPLDLFVAQLRALAATRQVIALSEMIDGMRRGANLAGTAAITFDDGFRNNVTRAAPALLDHRLPATFFLTTGFVGTDRCFRTDTMDRAVRSLVGHRESVQVAGQRIDLGSAAQASVGFLAAKRALKRLPLPQAEAIVQELESMAAELGLPPPGPDEKFMSWAEARSLVSAGFEVGAHTVNHPILSHLLFEQAREEILESRRRIEAEIGRCSPVFCYPNGRKEDLTPAITELCRSHFRAALSAHFGSARPSEIFELRRIGAATVGRPEALTWQLLRASTR
jgi:peptidoglycan/xylan/chitin deacetylase (PgdA/CDA1 family)